MSGILLPKRKLIGRRKFLGLSVAGLGATMLGGCDRLSESPKFEELLNSAEGLTYRAQRLLGGRKSMAREFAAADLSPDFKVNGTHAPDTPEYAALQEKGFADWRLRVDGLVVSPLDLSLAHLRALPQRTQSRGTIAWRAGAPSANGRARPSPKS
jgi:DMSO/TMAO reductase YedYZ molybdopterin-dependent catalytic subunit